MNKCPYCGAEIEENARFCLYCMRQLKEKKTVKNTVYIKYIIPIAACLIILGLVCLIFINPFNKNDKKENKNKNLSAVTSYPESNTVNKQSSIDSPSESGSDSSTALESHESSASQESAVTPPASDSSFSGSSTTPPQKDNIAGKPSKNDNLQTNQNDDNENLNSESASTEPTAPAYTDLTGYCEYRDAKSGDDYSTSFPFEDCIVITKITASAKEGIYFIPEKISGKTVIAIMPNTFYNGGIAEKVKKVIIPKSIKTLHEYTFSSCKNLTDIYFCGKAIYTDIRAFYTNQTSLCNSDILLHCYSDCNDRNFRYYRNTAPDYGLEYKEWDGEFNLD